MFSQERSNNLKTDSIAKYTLSPDFENKSLYIVS